MVLVLEVVYKSPKRVCEGECRLLTVTKAEGMDVGVRFEFEFGFIYELSLVG